MAIETKNKQEEQWFRENERNMLDQAHRNREKQMQEYRREHEKAEREKLRLAHWLKCPKCGNDLKVENLDGIEIDRCTVCSGIFFDHGELETLLMRKQEKRFSFYRRMFGLD